jgi:hypothetical protein
MKSAFYLVFLLLFTLAAKAQVPEQEQDTMAMDTIAFNTQLEELIIGEQDTVGAALKKQLALLQRRVLKVYPFAKVASDRLIMLDANMKKLKTNKEKKKYAKMVENYLENEFEAQLKKLTKKEGQILVKLIYRQTGLTTFDLISEHKSGWKAFWSQRMAKLFTINLKSKYSPATVAEDFMIEGFLIRAFDQKRLVKQDAAFKIDYPALKKSWKDRGNKQVQD